jgi:hypothetical protein
VRGLPRGHFLVGRSTEQVQAQVVAHDARQELRFDAGAVRRVNVRIVGRGLDRRPRRNPQRTDAGGFIENRRDVPAAFEHRHAKRIVFEDRGAAAVELFQIDHGAIIHITTWEGLPCGAAAFSLLVFRTVESAGPTRAASSAPGQSPRSLTLGIFVTPPARRVCPGETRSPGWRRLATTVTQVVSWPPLPRGRIDKRDID